MVSMSQPQKHCAALVREQLTLSECYRFACRPVQRAQVSRTAGCAEQRQEKKLTQAHFRPLCDGVFRAVPPTVNAKEFCGKILQQVPAPLLVVPPYTTSPDA